MNETLRLGSKGDSVLILQFLLKAVGRQTVTADGDFGKKTDAVVKNWQKKAGLTADGVVGQKTWASLLGVPFPTSGSKSEVLKPFIRSWEGGYANIHGDKGGPTKWGVTIATFRGVFGQNKTVEDLKNMTEAQWDYIYKKLFWDKWKADRIKCQAIANLLVDWYWNSGHYGIKIPQKVLGVTIDGIVGDKTIDAINNYKYGQVVLFAKLWCEREAYYHRIGKGTQAKFLNGWLNRLNRIYLDKLVCGNGKVIGL